MKLVTRRQHLPVSHRQRSAFPAIRWIRSRSAFERALLVKIVMVLLVAGIAIYAVTMMAHMVQTFSDGVNK